MESDIMPTLKNMLLCGLTPIGKCLYVFGGGWNNEKTKYRICGRLDRTGYLDRLMYQIKYKYVCIY